MRSLTIVLAGMLLVVGLPRAAAADKNIEIALSARANDGDSVHVIATGDNWSSLVGKIKLVCRFDFNPPLRQEFDLDGLSDTTADGKLQLSWGSGDGDGVIDMEAAPPRLRLPGQEDIVARSLRTDRVLVRSV